MTNRYRFNDDINEKTGKQQHLHTLDGRPLFGVSTVLSVLAKPLTWWASGLACQHLGWTNPKIEGTQKRRKMEERLPDFMPRYNELICMSPEEFLKTLDEAYKAHNVKLDTSATAGTDMHFELETYVTYCINFNQGSPIPPMVYGADVRDMVKPVELFANWAYKYVSLFIASEAYCYSEELWTGGIIDLIYFDENEDTVFFDFKSAKEAYTSHFLQNAGYDILVMENGVFDKNGNSANIEVKPATKYGVFPFGMKEPKPQFRNNVKDLQQGFRDCVSLYKLFQQGDKNYE